MRVAHFDCFSGISGDMSLGALFDAGVPAEPVIAGIASLGLPIEVRVEKVRKGGFAATQVHVHAPTQEQHRHLNHVEEILAVGKLTDRQRQLALDIFGRLARAEAIVHGMPIERVHFHEVGALDSIADIVGAAIGLDLLGVERFTSGSVPTGKGTVNCAHGLMPVPTPGTAELLRGVPLRPLDIDGELTTPTGAAILTTVVTDWTNTPAMTIGRIGVGAGMKDFAGHPNILRLFVGTSPAMKSEGLETDRIWMLETNLDDVSGEVVGFTLECLFAAGALDAFTIPIAMKKNRPGVLLSVLATEDKVAELEAIVFRETKTFGVRRHAVERHKLHRQAKVVETPWGAVQGKLGWREGHPPLFTPEHDACAKLAREHGIPLQDVHRAAHDAYRAVAAKQTPAT